VASSFRRGGGASFSTMVKVTFLDYGAGNILSLRNALEKVGCEIEVGHLLPSAISAPVPKKRIRQQLRNKADSPGL
jgi:hypothetical protein